MDARLARIETKLEHVSSDIQEIRIDVRDIRSTMRADFWAMVALGMSVAGALAGLMIKGFHWLP